MCLEKYVTSKRKKKAVGRILANSAGAAGHPWIKVNPNMALSKVLKTHVCASSWLCGAAVTCVPPEGRVLLLTHVCVS